MTQGAAADEIAETFAAFQARAWVHACPVWVRDSGGEVALDADVPAPAASVIEILVAVAFARAAVVGTLDPARRVEVLTELRIGGAGSAGFADPPLISLRDLALLMMTVSDNAATDLIFACVGREAIQRVVADLGLEGTYVRTTCWEALGKRPPSSVYPESMISTHAWPSRILMRFGRWGGSIHRSLTR